MNAVLSAGSTSTDKLLRSELRQGERLLWSGIPEPWRSARSKWLEALFGLVFASVPLVIMAVILKSQAVAASDIFAVPLFTVPPLLLGIGIWLASSPWRAYQTSGRTSYGVTDQRLLTIVTGANAHFISRFARELGSIARTQHDDGTGTLKFEHGVERDNKGRMNILKEEWCGLTDAKGAETAILSIMPIQAAAMPDGDR